VTLRDEAAVLELFVDLTAIVSRSRSRRAGRAAPGVSPLRAIAVLRADGRPCRLHRRVTPLVAARESGTRWRWLPAGGAPLIAHTRQGAHARPGARRPHLPPRHRHPGLPPRSRAREVPPRRPRRCSSWRGGAVARSERARSTSTVKARSNRPVAGRRWCMQLAAALDHALEARRTHRSVREVRASPGAGSGAHGTVRIRIDASSSNRCARTSLSSARPTSDASNALAGRSSTSTPRPNCGRSCSRSSGWSGEEDEGRSVDRRRLTAEEWPTTIRSSKSSALPRGREAAPAPTPMRSRR